MDKREIEAWANRVIDAVERGEPFEDSFVELKREWPKDHRKAAARIGGHANAANGEPFMWLIGVDQKNGNKGVVGAKPEELANWWPMVRKHFDDHVAPELSVQLDVPRDGKTVMALVFESDRAPYVIRDADAWGGVPWRAATGFRWARRRDLLQILWPGSPIPQVEVVHGRIQPRADNPCVIGVQVRLFLFLRGGKGRLTIPGHRCHGSVTFSEPQMTSPLGELQLLCHGGYPELPIMAGQVKLDGSGTIDISGNARLDEKPHPRSDAEVRLKLGILGRNEGVPVLLRFRRPEDHSVWKLAR